MSFAHLGKDKKMSVAGAESERQGVGVGARGEEGKGVRGQIMLVLIGPCKDLGLCSQE